MFCPQIEDNQALHEHSLNNSVTPVSMFKFTLFNRGSAIVGFSCANHLLQASLLKTHPFHDKNPSQSQQKLYCKTGGGVVSLALHRQQKMLTFRNKITMTDLKPVEQKRKGSLFTEQKDHSFLNQPSRTNTAQQTYLHSVLQDYILLVEVFLMPG